MMDKSSKEGRVGAANRAKILAAAEIEFAKNGLKGTRIQQVADRAGLPKTNVLYYFKTKENLYLEALVEILDLWYSAFDRATIEDDPAEVLAKYIKDKMDFSLERPDASRMFALEIINGAPHLTGFFQEKHMTWMSGRVAVIQGWIDLNKIDTPDAHCLLFHIWACCQHYADFASQITQLKNKEMDRLEFDKATIALTKLILNGCGLTVPEQYT